MAQLRTVNNAGQEADPGGSSFWFDQKQQMQDQNQNPSGSTFTGTAPLPSQGSFSDPRLQGNAQSPSERRPEEPTRGSLMPKLGTELGQAAMGAAVQGPPRTISPPSVESQLGGGGAQVTPRMPQQPNVGQSGAVSFPQQGAGAFRAPSPVDLIGEHSGQLYGKAGGLLGGGLGVPGQLGKGEEDPSKLLALLASLLSNKG